MSERKNGLTQEDLLVGRIRRAKKEAEEEEEKRRRRRQYQRASLQVFDDSLVVGGLVGSSTRASSSSRSTTQQGPRRKKGVVLYRDARDNKLKPLPPTMSSWYNLYCANHCEELTPDFDVKFRRRFRLPYSEYKNLVGLCEEDSMKISGYFTRWRPGKAGATGQPVSPLELLVLTALRYLGRGWTFDDLEEATAISEEVIRVFFHQFISWGADELYRAFVYPPRSIEEAKSTVQEYAQAGFAGCVGSIDATHVEHSRISYRHRQSHLSFKLPFTARSYNIICNHRRRIFCTTDGHPARWNDKSLVKFDRLAAGLHEGTSPLCDLQFELYTYGDDGVEVVKEKYRGGWLLVDNGYLNWGVTVPPMKETATMRQWRFSKWLESMRKDVECTFGILKGRWRVLKSGIRVHGTDASDNIWKTCCALHNMLLEVDGIAEDYSSDWLGELGNFSADSMPEPVRRLLSSTGTTDPMGYDISGMGRGSDGATRSAAEEQNEDDDSEEEENFVGQVVTQEGATVVRRLSMSQFREKLIVHFAICFEKKELAWPKQRLQGTTEPTLANRR
jgi:hypothetical protein